MNNYAVFNIKKPKGGLNSVAKHIKRTHHPDNARAELSHLRQARRMSRNGTARSPATGRGSPATTS